MAGSGWAIAGAAQISATTKARIRIMTTPGSEVGVRRASAGKFGLRLATTDGGTNAETSPPMAAICRTSVAVIGRTATEAE